MRTILWAAVAWAITTEVGIAQPPARAENRAAGSAKATPSGPIRVELIEMQITRPIATSGSQSDELFLSGFDGTALTLRLSTDKTPIVSVDPIASRLSRFADDKGTDLLDRDPVGLPSTLHALVAKNGHTCSLTLRSKQSPTPGAVRLVVRGELVVRCGEGEKTVFSEVIELKDGGRLELGTATATVTAPTGREMESFRRPYR